MSKFQKNAHCSYCGTAFPIGMTYPKKCSHCQQVTYINPLPVGVILLPVGDFGLVGIRRNIEPNIGKRALPGGFLEVGESWQQGAVRELREETGIIIDVQHVTHYRTMSAPDGTVLIFGLAEGARLSALPDAILSDETSEVMVIRDIEDFAFSTHAEVVQSYFGK